MAEKTEINIEKFIKELEKNGKPAIIFQKITKEIQEEEANKCGCGQVLASNK